MKNSLFSFILSLIFISFTIAQDRVTANDSVVTTKHTTTIKGVSFPYTANSGTLPVWEDEKAIASIYYTYYKRSDVKDDSSRPLVISFNGGPGSASVWMHVAYTGPKILNVDDEGYPLQPYGVKTNPYSILDVADIVYVNPVNTGYSRMIKDKEGKYPDRKKFFGINADIKYLAEWINTFVTRNNRWRSPKYIIGESYGGTRVAGLALELQESQWMY
ncbi:MAG: carboxypeptidase C (cathepsin A), partial [Urechidicola sp.]